jgi:hypothetical protein
MSLFQKVPNTYLPLPIEGVGARTTKIYNKIRQLR